MRPRNLKLASATWFWLMEVLTLWVGVFAAYFVWHSLGERLLGTVVAIAFIRLALNDIGKRLEGVQ